MYSKITLLKNSKGKGSMEQVDTHPNTPKSLTNIMIT